MRRIFKYELDVTDTQQLKLPAGARVLCVQAQHGNPCIWAEIEDEETAHEEREFATRGTGHPITFSTDRYVGTYQLHGGCLVFHVFETTDSNPGRGDTVAAEGPVIPEGD